MKNHAMDAVAACLTLHVSLQKVAVTSSPRRRSSTSYSHPQSKDFREEEGQERGGARSEKKESDEGRLTFLLRRGGKTVISRPKVGDGFRARGNSKKWSGECAMELDITLYRCDGNNDQRGRGGGKNLANEKCKKYDSKMYTIHVGHTVRGGRFLESAKFDFDAARFVGGERGGDLGKVEMSQCCYRSGEMIEVQIGGEIWVEEGGGDWNSSANFSGSPSSAAAALLNGVKNVSPVAKQEERVGVGAWGDEGGENLSGVIQDPSKEHSAGSAGEVSVSFGSKTGDRSNLAAEEVSSSSSSSSSLDDEISDTASIASSTNVDIILMEKLQGKINSLQSAVDAMTVEKEKMRAEVASLKMSIKQGEDELQNEKDEKSDLLTKYTAFKVSNEVNTRKNEKLERDLKVASEERNVLHLQKEELEKVRGAKFRFFFCAFAIFRQAQPRTVACRPVS